MMSDSDTMAKDLVSSPLLAFAEFAFAVTSLLPEGVLLHAAAAIKRDARTRIFFMMTPLLRRLFAPGFYAKTQAQSSLAPVVTM